MRPVQTRLASAATALVLALAFPVEADTAGQPTIDVRAEEPQGPLDGRGAPTRVPLTIDIVCGQAQAASPQYAVRLARMDPDTSVRVDFDLPEFNVSFENQECLAPARSTQTVNASFAVTGEAVAREPVPVGIRTTLLYGGNVVGSDEITLNVTAGFRAGLTANLVAANVTGEATVHYVFEIQNTGNGPASVKGKMGPSVGVLSTEPLLFSLDLARAETIQRAIDVAFRDCEDPSNLLIFEFTATGVQLSDADVASVQVRITDIPCEGLSTTAADFIVPVGLGLLALVAIGGLVAWFVRRASK